MIKDNLPNTNEELFLLIRRVGLPQTAAAYQAAGDEAYRAFSTKILKLAQVQAEDLFRALPNEDLLSLTVKVLGELANASGQPV
jgi:hypothetical protein